MKILLFTDADVFAGTERHIFDLAVALRAEGVAVEIACPPKGVLAERARAVDLPVFAIEKEPGIPWQAVSQVRLRLRKGEIDLVHSHNGRTALIAALAAATAGRGCTVTTQHFLQPSRAGRRGWRGLLSRAIHHWVLGQAARVVAISGPVRDAILERREVAPGKIERVWNGIADPTAMKLVEPKATREKLGLAADAPLIVCAARLEAEKQVEVLIDAMVAVQAAVTGAVCLVAGEGKLRPVLESRIQTAGLAGTVRLLGFQADVLSLVHASDVFVLPSAAEPFGLALVEAMALSRPVIATRAGGPIEIVVDGESGLLVTPGEASALSDAILRVLQEPALSSKLSAGARARFEAHFTAPRMAAAMAEVYRTALATS